MTQDEYDVLVRCGQDLAAKLIRRGVPPDQAVEIASQKAIEAVMTKYPDGLGQADVQQIDVFARRAKEAAEAAPVKTIREAVTPWLWVLSLISFAFSIANRKQIAEMYGKWRAGKGRKLAAP